MTIYFSIYARPSAGFTDQLYQFTTFYKLGLSVGYAYVHSPLLCRRSNESVYEFLDLNSLWPRQRSDAPFAAMPIVQVELSDALLERNRVRDMPGLQDYVRSTVARACRCGRDVVVQFSLAGGRFFFDTIHRSLPHLQDALDLRQRYSAAREREPWPSCFEPDKVRVLVHMRQGDTGVIRTPWQTFIPVWHKFTSAGLMELHDKSQIPSACVTEEDYEHFMTEFTKCFEPQSFSIVFASDGYAHAFRQLLNRSRTLELDAAKLEAIRAAAADYDLRMFAPFRAFPGAVCRIGEDPACLFDLIDCALTADIIVIGTQQRFILKLLACYPNPDRRTPVVILHRMPTLSPYLQGVALAEQSISVVEAHLDGTPVEDVARVVSELSGPRARARFPAR